MKKYPSHIVLGVDIGGTGIKAAPVDTRNGKLVTERFRVDTPNPATPKAVAAAVAKVSKEFSWRGPIGCTMPSVIKKGVIKTAANLSRAWLETNGVALLSKATRNKVFLMNDADAAGLAEMKFGAGENLQGLVILVTLGTGIGTAIFHDGNLIPNSELGHLELEGADAELLASNRVREEEDLSWKDWAKNVEKYLKSLESLLWPDLFIIGGGVSKKAEKFIPKIKTRTKIVPAKLLNNAGIVGAAWAAKNQ